MTIKKQIHNSKNNIHKATREWHGGKGDRRRTDILPDSPLWEKTPDLTKLINELLFSAGPQGLATCRVISKDKVQFRGKHMSLKEATRLVHGTAKDHVKQWGISGVPLRELL